MARKVSIVESPRPAPVALEVPDEIKNEIEEAIAFLTSEAGKNKEMHFQFDTKEEALLYARQRNAYLTQRPGDPIAFRRLPRDGSTDTDFYMKVSVGHSPKAINDEAVAARAWAKSRGLEVKERGRVPTDILNEYRKSLETGKSAKK